MAPLPHVTVGFFPIFFQFKTMWSFPRLKTKRNQFTLIKKDLGDWLKLNNVAWNIPLSHSLSLSLSLFIFKHFIVISVLQKLLEYILGHFSTMRKTLPANGNSIVVNTRRNSYIQRVSCGRILPQPPPQALRFSHGRGDKSAKREWLVMNGRRSDVSPVVSFPSSFARTFSSKRERRLGTRQILPITFSDSWQRTW